MPETKIKKMKTENGIPLTNEEIKAVEALEKVFKKFPKTLWLFNDGTMSIMKYSKDGKAVYTKEGSVDQGYVVTVIHNLHSEGGAW